MDKERRNAKDITAKELESWQAGTYRLIDLREPEETDGNALPGAVHMELECLLKGRECHALEDGLPIVLLCQYGEKSLLAADALAAEGYDAYNLAGGYGSWLLQRIHIARDAQELRREEIEKGIRKRFKRDLFTPFAKAVSEYQLVEEGDRICVCISGGKDSTLMAKLFQELKRHNKFQFSLRFLCMDPGYRAENRRLIEENAALLGIPLEFFESDIFDTVYKVEKSPCYLCARMRRGHLYKEAKARGCNKIALGHHFDDVIETILMGILYSGQFQAMMPKLHSTHFPGMELIRPMYRVREADILRWRDANGLHFLQCACRFTDTCESCHTDGTTSSKRLETKKLIQTLKKQNPYVEKNLFKSMENISPSTILGYKKDGVKHSFLEWYGKETLFH